MKILHTSDWHLGQKFIQHDRREEHAMALQWLLETIEEEAVDALIVAGDIFDITSPPNYARALYFDFLKRLLKTRCRHVIIVGGNHDSPAMLNASASLLEAFDIYVVATSKDPISEQVIELKNDEGKLEAVVAAVPFLRERDLLYTHVGETTSAKAQRLQEGIAKHYADLAAIVEKYPADVPRIATGHLYASGASTSEKQDNIYLGNIENIRAEQFPTSFDYIALGHIHRPQKIGGKFNVRYSGSIIPLSFSERSDAKSVVLLDLTKEGEDRVQIVDVPRYRRLKTIKGSFEEVKEKLAVFVATANEEPLKPWLEIIVEAKELIPQLNEKVQALAEGHAVEILKVRVNYERQEGSFFERLIPLEELTPLEIFQQKCQSYGAMPEDMNELENTFLALQTWMNERTED